MGAKCSLSQMRPNFIPPARRQPSHPTQSGPRRPHYQLIATTGSTVYLNRSYEEDDEVNKANHSRLIGKAFTRRSRHPPIDLRLMCPPPLQPPDLRSVHGQVLREHVNVLCQQCVLLILLHRLSIISDALPIVRIRAMV